MDESQNVFAGIFRPPRLEKLHDPKINPPTTNCYALRHCIVEQNKLELEAKYIVLQVYEEKYHNKAVMGAACSMFRCHVLCYINICIRR